MELPKIYPITKTDGSALPISAQAEQMAAAGARLIQVRAKTMSPGQLLSDIIDALAAAKRYGAKLVVNDRVDLAIAAGADGLHLGQNDLPPKQARELLGRKSIIGYSTHNVSQAKAAMLEPIDYIAIGPVFPTLTKPDHDSVIGLDIVSKVRKELGSFPLVAIGGITHANARSVIEAGADSVAIIGAVSANGRSIDQNVKDLIAHLSDQ